MSFKLLTTIDSDTKKQLDKYVKSEGRQITYVVNRAIKEFVERENYERQERERERTRQFSSVD
jgi:predicted transcriptional regulator